MEEVLESSAHAVKEYGKYFGFDSFGDSNVNFWLFVQAKDRWGSFVVQTELMQKLHQRLKTEGIVINYPMRTLQFPDGWAPPLAAGQAPPTATGQPRSRPGRSRPPRDFHLQTESDQGPDGDADGEAPA